MTERVDSSRPPRHEAHTKSVLRSRVPCDLSFFDDFDTPANVLDRVKLGMKMSDAEARALARLLARNPGQWIELRKALGDHRYRALLEEAWQMLSATLDPSSGLAFGIRLAFWLATADASQKARDERWVEVGDHLSCLIRCDSGAKLEILEALEEEVGQAIDEGAAAFWESGSWRKHHAELSPIATLVHTLRPTTKRTKGVQVAFSNDSLDAFGSSFNAAEVELTRALAPVLRRAEEDFELFGYMDLAREIHRRAASLAAVEALARNCHPLTGLCLARLISPLLESPSPVVSVSFARPVLAFMEQFMDDKSYLLWKTRKGLGVAQLRAGHLPEAEALLLKSLQEQPKDSHSARWLATLYRQRNAPGDQERAVELQGVVNIPSPRLVPPSVEQLRLDVKPEEFGEILQALWERRDYVREWRWQVDIGVPLAFWLAEQGRGSTARNVWSQIDKIYDLIARPDQHDEADLMIIHLHTAMDPLAQKYWRNLLSSASSPLVRVAPLLRQLEPGISPAGPEQPTPAVLAKREARRGRKDRLTVEQIASTLLRLSTVARGRSDRAQANDIYNLAVNLCVLEVLAGSGNLCTASYMNRLAIYLLRSGEPEAALPLARRALEIRRNSFTTTHNLIGLSAFNLASILVDLGKLDEAETLLDEARRVAPSRATTYYWFGKLYQKRSGEGDREREIANLNRYLELGPDRQDRFQEVQNRLKEIIPE